MIYFYLFLLTSFPVVISLKFNSRSANDKHQMEFESSLERKSTTAPTEGSRKKAVVVDKVFVFSYNLSPLFSERVAGRPFFDS